MKSPNAKLDYQKIETMLRNEAEVIDRFVDAFRDVVFGEYTNKVKREVFIKNIAEVADIYLTIEGILEVH